MAQQDFTALLLTSITSFSIFKRDSDVVSSCVFLWHNSYSSHHCLLPVFQRRSQHERYYPKKSRSDGCTSCFDSSNSVTTQLLTEKQADETGSVDSFEAVGFRAAKHQRIPDDEMPDILYSIQYCSSTGRLLESEYYIPSCFFLEKS